MMNPVHRVAIVGVGGVFPGANGPDALWEIVAAGRSMAREVPQGRWLIPSDDAFRAGPPTADHVYSRRGCFVTDFELDPTGFHIEPSEWRSLDPLVSIGLAAAKQAWDDAATKSLDRRRVGVSLGNIALPTGHASALGRAILSDTFAELLGVARESSKPVPAADRFVTGNPAGLIGNALRLGGGTRTLDAACASSLYAIKLAVDELLAGRVDAMLSGGMSRPDCLYTQMGFAQLHALSPSGRCSPFDVKADGLVVGEGAGIFVLKRLADALAHGDHIYATIAGIGLSNDVEGNLLAPSSEGQLRAMRAAYDAAEWAPESVELIECHATGTPIGDGVEFASLEQLWKDFPGEAGRCVIGSVKSNVGHLLTGAGGAGLAKTLWAMRHGVLPPTANFESPAAGARFSESPFRVLSRAERWPRGKTGTPRRAAVSAFGFGGINAHLLIEEWLPASSAIEFSPPAVVEPPAIAVVGAATHFGPCADLSAFQDLTLGESGESHPRPLQNWFGVERSEWFQKSVGAQGAYLGYPIDELKVPIGKFSIPPRELEEMLPQQMLMLQVAADALDDAGAAISSTEQRWRTGVVIGLALDLNTTNFDFRWSLSDLAKDDNGVVDEERLQALRDAAGPALNANRTMGALGGIVASRIARVFHIGGPSFAASSEETSGLRAVEIGARLLQEGSIDRVLVGAVDLACDVRAVLATDRLRRFSRTGRARPFDEQADGPTAGEGAAAVVLKRHDDAVRDGDHIYAVLRGIGSASHDGAGTTPDENDCGTAIARASVDARIDPASIDLLEVHGSGDPQQDLVEAAALAGLPVRDKGYYTVSSAAASIGHAGAAAGLASFVKACLALHAGVLPATPPPTNLLAALKNRNDFRFRTAPIPWLRDPQDGPRRALVGSLGIEGNAIYAILEASPRTSLVGRKSGAAKLNEYLFCMEGDDQSALLIGLARLRQHVQQAPSLRAAARSWYESHPLDPAKRLGLALIAGKADEILQTLDLAQRRLAIAAAVRRSPDERVFFSAAPLSRNGSLAFVFPGSGSQFSGMGRRLALDWPDVLHTGDGRAVRLASRFQPEVFWDADEGSFRDFATPLAVIQGQVALATFITDLLARFGVKPAAALGYSLGESAALFATRAWPDWDLMIERLQRSSLFTTELAGPCNAARKAWGLSAADPVDWRLGVIDLPAEETRELLRGRERVYLLLINTPNECVIGGDRTAVDTFVRDAGRSFLRIDGVSTVHCEVARVVEAEYRALHEMPTNAPPGVRFYSGAWNRAFTPDSVSAADAITQQAMGCLDFPAVVRTAYADGVKLFVEVGPGAACCRMIDAVLKESPHLATPTCLPNVDETGRILRVLGALFAERIPINLNYLFRGMEAAVAVDPKQNRFLTIPVGGKPFVAPSVANTKRRSSTSRHHSHERRMQISAPVASAGSVHISESSTAPGQPKENPLVAFRSGEGPNANSFATYAFLDQWSVNQTAFAEAHGKYLELNAEITASIGRLLATSPDDAATDITLDDVNAGDGWGHRSASSAEPPRILSREQCMEFAVGSIAAVLGERFAEIDAYPTRVRLPDEPLMLVDRILSVEAEPLSMSHGRVVTEHDVLPGAWYLDCGRIPTCIAVESGQADLFLAGFLGVDLETKGEAVYRLLDAVVTFHSSLPTAGKIIRYDIKIDEFFRQGETHLFRFQFDAMVDGELLLTMREGCAGFFTAAALAGGKGVVRTALDKRSQPGKRPVDWEELTPFGVGGFSDRQVEALRSGDLGAAFGRAFENLGLQSPAGLPSGRMNLVHRVPHLDPSGGRFGLGIIRGEADVHADDWYLTCHFIDDQVMPGTLMYECCLHTLRIFLSRMGWIGEEGAIAYEPVPAVGGRLKCRGQVTAGTNKVTYEVEIKELGYGPAPFAIADALMYADGKPIVEMTDMSLQISGLDLAQLRALWKPAPAASGAEKQPLFDFDRILAFAVGKPSKAFGAPYRIFDSGRKIARLPGPPYQFLDRITAIQAEPWKMTAGGVIEAEYDVPVDAWYFDANAGSGMPFAVLLEIALQPCGWLAAYIGSALTSETDLSFRNLGGRGVQFRPVDSEIGTLTTTVKITKVSSSVGMIIQHYEFSVRSPRGPVYQGDTYFGFFSKQALANQVGMRDAMLYTANDLGHDREVGFDYPSGSPFVSERLRMVDRIDHLVEHGGPTGKGLVDGVKRVDPSEWFFKAHFFEDPVCPGSLGLESMLQLLKAAAAKRWGRGEKVRFQTMLPQREHSWSYRGQVIPTDHEVRVQAAILDVDDAKKELTADGLLSVDGRIIYQMQGFTLGWFGKKE